MEPRRGKKETHRRKQTAVAAAGRREQGWPGDEDKQTSPRGPWPGRRRDAGRSAWEPMGAGTVGAGRSGASRESGLRSRLSPAGLGGAGRAAGSSRRPPLNWCTGRAGEPVGQRFWRARGLMEQKIGGAGRLVGR